MSDAKNKVTILQQCLGEGVKLTELVDYAADSIVSKTILDKGSGTITLFAFDKGQKLSEHTSPYDAVVQVIEGVGAMTIGGEKKQIATGEIIIMPANVEHSVSAEESFKMVLTMIRR